MIRSEGVRIKVPASTANLGPGFDTLGMALSLFAWIEMKPAERTVFHLYGEELRGIPKDKSNLVYKLAQQVFAEAGVAVPELEISMASDIPLTRGLGSSASAIVGALYAANELIGAPLSMEKLFDMATAVEKHPDNVGASLFGGIVSAVWDGERAVHLRIEPPAELQVLVAIPSFWLPTEQARKILPDSLSMKDVVFNVSRASLLTGALASGRLDLIAAAMQDRIHQPYRAPLIPGMEQILAEACSHGALGAALSGAGPTLLALVERNSDRRSELEAFIQRTLGEHGIEAKLLWLEPCSEGASRVGAHEAAPFAAGNLV
ncbi:homoserine kinase [Paenibacillus yonginensis]|uniref:Homoserine kinase n=1 Tax=Paenibacillus yonginensis TaxID=1462996 RepID=A0A1B1N231_9BACL|nr:homoserine kinase [Paenibacillus yonginensis]ANS75487.1 homoserine kinase [Paenibacillus yonginensis]